MTRVINATGHQLPTAQTEGGSPAASCTCVSILCVCVVFNKKFKLETGTEMISIKNMDFIALSAKKVNSLSISKRERIRNQCLLMGCSTERSLLPPHRGGFLPAQLDPNSVTPLRWLPVMAGDSRTNAEQGTLWGTTDAVSTKSQKCQGWGRGPGLL